MYHANQFTFRILDVKFDDNQRVFTEIYTSWVTILQPIIPTQNFSRFSDLTWNNLVFIKWTWTAAVNYLSFRWLFSCIKVLLQVKRKVIWSVLLKVFRPFHHYVFETDVSQRLNQLKVLRYSSSKMSLKFTETDEVVLFNFTESTFITVPMEEDVKTLAKSFFMHKICKFLQWLCRLVFT